MMNGSSAAAATESSASSASAASAASAASGVNGGDVDTVRNESKIGKGPWYMRHSFTDGPTDGDPEHMENRSEDKQAKMTGPELLHDADEEVMRIVTYQGEGDARGQAVVPTLEAPKPPPASSKPSAASSSSSSAPDAGSKQDGSGEQAEASQDDNQAAGWEARIEAQLDEMDFEQHIPKYTVDMDSVEVDLEADPGFLDRFFLAVDQGDAEQVFAMVADPAYQAERWEEYCRDLRVQIREEAREELAEVERRREAEARGETYFKRPVYIKRAKKPWEPRNIDDSSFIPVKRGIDLNARDPSEFNSTALHKAVRKMRMDCVTLLTRCEQCDVNLANDFGETPLHFAVKNGHVQSTYVLLKRGARIDVRDKAYDSPMSLGIKLARDGCCKLLVEFGADVSELYDRNLVRVRKMNLENDEDGANVDGIVFDAFGFPVDKSRNARQDASRAVIEQWRTMLKNMYRKGKLDKSLKKKIRKGVPNAVRGILWKTFLPIEELKRENPGVYQKLLEKPSESSKQIDLDINRTFREHRDFRERYGPYQIKLFNVLKAYSLHNPAVGYTQGMSSLTAFFLMYLPQEEDAFWMLDIVLGNPKYDLQSIFLPGFPRLYECFYVHEKLLAKTMPALARHFESQGIMTSMYATKWYMLLMMDILPFSTVARLWDIFLFEGNKVVFNVILSVFKILEPKLMSMNFEEIMTYLAGLDRVEMTEIDPEKLIMLATEKKVKHKHIKSLISQYRKENGLPVGGVSETLKVTTGGVPSSSSRSGRGRGKK